MELDKALPLQTIQSMAERWGVQAQVVNNWRARHDDFPHPIEGIIEKTARTPLVFSNEDVRRYERNRKLPIKDGY